jgi:hypothetical protein
MADQVSTVARWIFIANGVIALLGATVLYRAVRTRFIDPWLRFGARATGQPMPTELPAMLREPFVRTWLFLMGIVMLGAGWYLGTPTGEAFVKHALTPFART